MPQQKDIVKIAIQMPGAYPQLIQLDQASGRLRLRLASPAWNGEVVLLRHGAVSLTALRTCAAQSSYV
ncbi:engulfment and cell motility protein 3 [Tachysurus ichikawai]